MRAGIARVAGVIGLTMGAAIVAAALARRIAPLVDPEQAEPQKEPSVYVKDSAKATDNFEAGKRMERLKEWHKAAPFYQEILRELKEPVVLTREEPYRLYQGITWAVRDRLARWPAEGLAVYRGLYEPEAATLLEKASRADSPALQKILNQYFVTESGKQAGIRLMDLNMEAGDFAGVTWVGDLLLQRHPTLGADRAAVLFRTAVAYHLSGNTEIATKRFEELKANHANEMGLVAGKETKLADALAIQLERKPPVAGGAGVDSWRTVGGDASRGMIPPGGAKAGTCIYSIPLPGPAYQTNSEQEKRQIQPFIDEARNNGMTIAVMPAVDRGELFFQDGQRMWAVHLESGVPLAGWQQTYPQRQGQYVAGTASNVIVNMGEQWNRLQANAPRQHSLTLTDDAVLAVMGQPEVRPGFAVQGMAGPGGGGTRLVCLDRATGKQRWMVDPNTLPGNQGNPKNLSFSGSPLVAGDNVCVIARGSGGAGVEDCNLFCFDLEKGEFKWSCYIASSQGSAMMGMPIVISGDTLSHPAFASGRIYVLTNLGAVAAVDAFTGETIWVALYPRDPSKDRQRGQPMAWGGPVPTNTADRVKPWEFNPVIAQDGKVFALPLDGTHLMVYDAGTGEELKRVPREIEYTDKTDRLTMLLGVAGKTIVTGSNDSLFVLNWALADPIKPGDKRLNPAALDYAGIGFIDDITGRPFLSSQRIFLPRRSSLSVFDLGRKRIVERTNAPWADEQGPGNVVATSSHVIIANAKNISVYTDIQSVRQKYAALIKSDPGNLDHRLVLMELLFNAHEIDDSRAAMDQAIEVLGGMKAMRPGGARDRIFSDSLLFAQKLAAEKTEASIAAAEQFYNRAAAAASTPSQQVNYQLSRAKFIETPLENRKEDLAAAVKLYQEILSDPQMRIIMLSGDEKTASTSAARRAESAIADLIKKAGPTIYEAFQKEAADKLAALSAAGNPDQLLALAENYPNATSVAAQAMMRAASIYEKSNLPKQATQVLRRLNWKYAGSPEFSAMSKNDLQEAMARNHLRHGNAGAALGRMLQFKSDTKLSTPLLLRDGKPLATPDGQAVQTTAQAVVAIKRLLEQREEAPLPDSAIPLPPQDRQAKRLPPFDPATDNAIIPDVQALVAPPPAASISGTRSDRLVAWSAAKLLCLAPGQAQPLWSSSALGEDADGLYWIDKNLLTWSDGEVALLDGEKGTAIWKSEIKSLVAVQIVAAAGVNDGPANETRTAAQPIQVPDELRARMVRQRAVMRVGGVVQIQPAAAEQPVPADGRERVMHVCPLPDRVIVSSTTGRVYALDLANGRVLWQTRLANSRAIQQTLGNDEFTVLRTMDGSEAQLVVLDSFNGQQLVRLRFPVTQPRWPINCILSPDGVLVWTTAESIAAKDLYEPGTAPSWERTGRSFAGLTRSDQLAIWGEQVFAIYNNERFKFIDRRKLRNGDASGLDLSTPGTDYSARLRLCGPRLYAVSNQAGIVYNLERDVSSEYRPNDDVVSMADRAMFTRDYAILPGQAVDAERKYSLQCYCRALLPRGTDDGRQVYRFDFAEAGKIKACQAVDGGIYYLAGDDKLHWLKGGRR